MYESATIYSLDALDAWRGALADFGHQGLVISAAMELEIQRTIDWITQDRPAYWRSEVRRRQDDLAHALADLNRARMAAVFDRPPQCVDQKIAVEKARRRLAEAEEKVALVRRHAELLAEQIDEFRRTLRKLVDRLEHGLPAALHLVDRMVDRLQKYIETRPAPAPPARPAEGRSP